MILNGKLMKKSASIIILFLSLIPFRSYAQAPEERFTEANNLYQSGDYSGAASIYSKLYEEGLRSEALLYNAGNAFYKSGDNAAAILFYERAQLLSPADEDIDYNLQIARSRVSDKFDEIPRVFFTRWFDFIALLISTNSWAIITLLFFILFLISGALFLTRPGGRGKALSFWISIFAVIFAVITLSLSMRNNNLVSHNNRAVVMCSILTGTSEPGESGNELFVIHSGTTIVIEDVLGDYSEIRLPDGTKGWVKGDCIERI